MLPSGLAEIVADDEDLARFLTQSNRFTAIVVKAAEFLPRVQDKETSVSRHGREPVERLWALGLEAAGRRPLYGAAIFKASSVRSVGLDVIADEPPPRHAAIKGWPWVENDRELEKARQRELALVIAKAAGPPLLR